MFTFKSDKSPISHSRIRYIWLVDGWMDGIAVTTRTDLNYLSLLLMLEQTHTGMNLRCLISGTPLKGP